MSETQALSAARPTEDGPSAVLALDLPQFQAGQALVPRDLNRLVAAIRALAGELAALRHQLRQQSPPPSRRAMSTQNNNPFRDDDR